VSKGYVHVNQVSWCGHT